MTKQQLLKIVRRQFEELSSDAQAVAARRALGRDVFWWDGLTSREVEQLCGAIVAARLVFDVEL
jgi:hypothetical protein